MKVAIGVPVLYNFEGFTKLVESVQGSNASFYVKDNWNENVGVAVAWNEFIDRAIEDDVDLLFICNDDLTFKKNAVQETVEAWKNRPNDCVILLSAPLDVEKEFIPGGSAFCAFAFNPKEALDKIGYFDADNFYPAYFEDSDYLRRIELSEYRQYHHGAFRVFHEGSVTQFWNGGDDRTVSHEQFRANQNRYIMKWGGLPNDELYTKPFIKND